ncbi:hypothetical protein ACFL60_02900, partial [Candidatus Omnitrophota bacterium]
MKSIIVFIILINILIPSVSARIWKVGYGINEGDFTTIQEAHDAAAAGDTLYVAGGEYNRHVALIVTKKIALIGTGYFLNENPDTQASPYVAQILNNLYFNPGSDGSIISGFELHYNNAVNVNNVIIKRNYIHGSGAQITLNGNNAIIHQNYFDMPAVAVTFASDNIHAVISNNFCHVQARIIISPDNSTVNLINNIFTSPTNSNYNLRGRVDVKNGVFRNNIFIR